MELKEKIAQKILKLKLGKVKNGSHQEIQKLQQEYDKLANENQPNITTKQSNPKPIKPMGFFVSIYY